MGLLLEQGSTYRLVLCPENLRFANNIQILIFKIRSRAQPCPHEGLEDESFKAWKHGFDYQALGIWVGGSGGARDEIQGADPQPAQGASGFELRARTVGNTPAQPA